MSTQKIEQRWTKFAGSLDEILEGGTTPRQWITQGFSVKRYQAWYEAGGFDPEEVKKLEEHDIDPGEVARYVTEEDREKHDGILYCDRTIACMFCNGDLTIETVKELIANDDYAW